MTFFKKEKTLLKLTLICLFLFLTTLSYSYNVDGKWYSSTENRVYIFDDEGEIRIQIADNSGQNYVWIGKWVKFGKSFSYQTSEGTFEAVIENRNLIIIRRPDKLSFIWRRANPKKAYKRKRKVKKRNYKKYKKRRVKKQRKRRKIRQMRATSFPGERRYKYYYSLVEWEIKQDFHIYFLRSILKNGYEGLYSWTDKEGRWLSIVIPIVSVSYKNWGVSLQFVRQNNRWILKDMRKMKLVPGKRGMRVWRDDSDYSVPVSLSDNIKLEVKKNNEFVLSYYGNLKVSDSRWIKRIFIRGKSKTITYKRYISNE